MTSSDMVCCKQCSDFVQKSGSDMALGRCKSNPHDGHQGQWPYRRHRCKSFVRLGASRSSGSSGQESGTEVTWVCGACNGDGSFTHDDFLKHLQTVHGFDPRGQKGEKSLISHMDAADQFLNIYSWKIGGITAVQTVCTPRGRRR